MAKYISDDMIDAMRSKKTFLEDEKKHPVKKSYNSCYESCLAICREVKNDVDFFEGILDVFLEHPVVTTEKAMFCAMLCASTQRNIPYNIWLFLEENLTVQEFLVFFQNVSNLQKL